MEKIQRETFLTWLPGSETDIKGACMDAGHLSQGPRGLLLKRGYLDLRPLSVLPQVVGVVLEPRTLKQPVLQRIMYLLIC